MNRKPVVSSFLKSVGYDERTRTLEIEFKPAEHGMLETGKVFAYADVPPNLANELVQSPSPGNFFRHKISKDYEGVPVENIIV
jgi:hypothetical protein